MPNETNVLVAKEQAGSSIAVVDSQGNLLPAMISSAGQMAQFAWEEFIYGKIRNPHTRAAYERAIRRF